MAHLLQNKDTQRQSTTSNNVEKLLKCWDLPGSWLSGEFLVRRASLFFSVSFSLKTKSINSEASLTKDIHAFYCSRVYGSTIKV